MNLLFTVDQGNINILAKCLRSIRRFSAEGGYDVYILHPDLRESNIESLKCELERPPFREKTGNATELDSAWEKMQLYPIQVNASAFDFFPEHHRYPKTMYYRIFAASLLPDSLDRILYLDPDLVVIHSLNELYHMDLGDHYFLGCSHTQKMLTEFNRMRLDLPKEAHYINTGVLLMNLSLLRREQSRDEVVRYVEQYGKVFTLPDQDIISALYGHRTGMLDTLRYNLSDRILNVNNANPLNTHIDVDWVRQHGVIVHYCGKNKPWKENYHGVLDVFYDEVP